MTTETSHTDPLKTPSGHEAQQTGRQPTTPIAGIDEAALAGSAIANKLIGSKVYKGDTSIGKLVAVPVSQGKVGSEASFMTDLTEAQLASAPEFDFGIVDQNFPDQKSVHAVSHGIA